MFTFHIFLEIIFALVRLEKIPAQETLVVPCSLSRMEGEMLYLYLVCLFTNHFCPETPRSEW